jgi:glutamyl-Q tRNA(Asp) synthetase
LGLASDEPPTYQSNNSGRYLQALASLQLTGQLFSCRCSRIAVEQAAQGLGLPPTVYPGTCRDLGLAEEPAARRVRVPTRPVAFVDRACGEFSQQLDREVGDFVVRRADGLWAYQLAVVVDDAAQRVTDVVRGADLLDNTPRQIHLQRLLMLPTPRYLHVPVVRNAAGEKLSKQTGAAPLQLSDPVGQLEAAWKLLDFAPTGAATVAEFLAHAVLAWQARWCRASGRVDTIGAASLPPLSRPGADSNRPE